MTVAVVTGATGFIGQHLCRRLLAEGWSVRALDLAERPVLPQDPKLEFRAVDIRDTAAVEAALEGADFVFHLASAHLEVSAPEGWYESINVEAVRSLVAACARAGIQRLVHTSSVGIYGDVQNPPADEDSPKHPVSEYERTKLLGETAALEAAREHGVDLIVLRPGWVYGPGCGRTAKLLKSVARGRFLYVGGGSNLRHPIHISDAVEAYLFAARASEDSSGKPYLIVGPRAVTVRELVEACARATGVRPPSRSVPRPLMLALVGGAEAVFKLAGKQPPVSRRSLAFFENNNAFDGSAAARELGFGATIDLDEGLRLTDAQLKGAKA